MVKFVFSFFLVFSSLICHAELSKDQIIATLSRTECCVQDISFTTWEDKVFAVVTFRQMRHEYCDSNYVFVSHDAGHSFHKQVIEKADDIFWLQGVTFSPETKALVVKQGIMCFLSTDYGLTFTQSVCAKVD